MKCYFAFRSFPKSESIKTFTERRLGLPLEEMGAEGAHIIFSGHFHGVRVSYHVYGQGSLNRTDSWFSENAYLAVQGLAKRLRHRKGLPKVPREEERQLSLQ